MNESNTSIVQSGALDRFESFDPTGFLGSIVDAKSAKQATGRIKVLEEMLKAAEQFGEYASKFCLLEAQMYIQIADVKDSDCELSSTQRDTVKWLRGKSSAERNAIIAECGEGVRIRVIRNREAREWAKSYSKKASDNEYKRIQTKILNEMKTQGVTKLNSSRFFEEWELKDAPDSKTVRAYVESTRDELLKSNACGMGDGSGTYALPSVCDRKKLAEIVSNRLRSIYADIKQLKQICDENSFRVPYSGVNMLISSLREIQYEVPND